MAPASYKNQTAMEEDSLECRLGKLPGRPWTGVTACMDFCAHSHKDFHNMNNGCTVVVTLTKHRGLGKPEDEQLHVLPLYRLDATPSSEDGETQEEIDKRKQSGALEILNKCVFLSS
jgi:methylcytosine dioxygenase